MLEPRSAYGYYGVAGGATGENEPSYSNCVERRMPYYKFKRDYKECAHYDYDPKDKTIIVLIPEERQNTPNFGNKYRMDLFHFWCLDERNGYYFIAEQKAKTEQNAEKYMKRWDRTSHRDNYNDPISYIRPTSYGEWFKYGSKRLTKEEFSKL